MEALFFLNDISLVIIAATALAMLAGKLKQPLILGYVLAGMLIIPLNLVKDTETIRILSDLGIAFLLFIIGLELDFKRLMQVGLKSSIIGVLQVLLTAAIGFIVAYAILKFDTITSIYIALIISFSSTMIVAKLLGEQMELESLHGELVLVILIIQDILAVIALSIIKTGSTLQNIDAMLLLILAAKGALLIALSYLIYKVLPFFLKEAVHSAELIFISALTTMFIFSGLAYLLGYSFSIGAFIAGVSLSTTKYNHEITGRVKSLKDFFLVLLFVSLGMGVTFTDFRTTLLPLTVLLLTVLVIKPILIFLLVKKFEYSNRTSFFTGIQLAQVGEFSLVLAAEGMALNHIKEPAVFSMMIILTIVTMIMTSYIIKYDDTLYNRYFSKLLKPFERESKREKYHIKEKMRNHIVIFGLHRMSEKIISELKKTRRKFVVVDHNPEKINKLAEENINCVCSDMTNPDVYEQVNISEAKAIISTVHNISANMALISKAKQENNKATIMVAGSSEQDALRLYESGADYVIIPLILGGEKVISYLKHLKHTDIMKWGQKCRRELAKYSSDNKKA